jgi:two-component system chemotaxis response regulator CheY
MTTIQKKLNVLIVDDNETTRALLRMIIQGDAYDVVGEAANGATGLERALKLRPDIICLDVMMPDSDGLEILQEIKKKLPRSMVLMVTASNDAKTVQTAISRGACGFIIKPFSTGTVLDTLQKTAVKISELKS